MKTKKITRRSFNKKLATASAAVVASQFPNIGKSEPTVMGEACTQSLVNNTFDYIVVGSGAGGGPVACRLARQGFKVCLMEAGNVHTNQNYEVPAFHGMSTEDENYAWNFYVDHFKNKFQQTNDPKLDPAYKKILYPRAATLGGCTAHNAMITMYPDHDDWKKIADITEDRSWSPEHMRTYYQKVERASYLDQKHPDVNGQQRGFEGWLNVEQNNIGLGLKDPTFRRIIWETLKKEGFYPQKPGFDDLLKELTTPKLDPNMLSYVNHKTDGFYNIPKATHHGRRNGTREFILETMSQFENNLHLERDALVSEILFHDERDREGNLVAKGISFYKGSGLYEADPKSRYLKNRLKASTQCKRQFFARREVIVSGGAFNSPQLLMLSGIGPAAELRKHDIKVKLDLAGVGKNLQDRYEVGIVSKLKAPIESLSTCTFAEVNDPCLADWQKEADGVGKPSTYGTNGMIASVLRKSHPSRKNPDLFLFAVPGDFRGYFRGWAQKSLKKDHFTWLVLKGHTANRSGQVTLKSNNPFETPKVEFNYFSDGSRSLSQIENEMGERHRDEDLITMKKEHYPDTNSETVGLDEIDLDGIYQGVKHVQEINANMKDLIETQVSPDTQVQSKDDLKEFITSQAWGHHASCSNKIGSDRDHMAVLDANFKVRGTSNLRVVDASVFPEIPGLFIVVPIYMIAEKAADVIIAEAKTKTHFR